MERCPKCGTAQRGETACRSCGLAADRMAGYAAVRDAKVSPAVLAAWTHAEDHWTDEAAHDAVWKLVAATGAYGWAAGRYRAASLERPDDPIAKVRLAAISRAAEATMVATAGVRRHGKPAYRGASGILALLILMAIIGLAYAFIRSSQIGDEPGAMKSDNPAQVR